MNGVQANVKTDGQAGAPLIVGLASQEQRQAPQSGPNAALKEPAPKPGDGVDRAHRLAANLRVLDRERGVVGTADGSPRRKKIAICGFASSTRHYILQSCNDPSWEIWGLNQLYRHIPRADVWFDIHHNWDQEVVPNTDHRKWARECGIPFYMMRPEPDIPTAVRYPIEPIIGIYTADYFTSTIAYMLALALLEIDARVQADMQKWLRDLASKGDGEVLLHPEFHIQDVVRQHYAQYTVGVFGVDLVVGGEYFHEKPCAEFWIGALAIGRGIELAIPRESALCKQLHRYGYEKEPDQLLKSEEIEKNSAHLQAERDEQLKKLYMLEGAMQMNERWKSVIELRARGAKVE